MSSVFFLLAFIFYVKASLEKEDKSKGEYNFDIVCMCVCVRVRALELSPGVACESVVYGSIADGGLQPYYFV